MIAHMTQIVHNDILVKELSAHGHSKCKCGTSSAKKETQNNKLDCNPPSPQRELTGVRVLSEREVWYFVSVLVLTNLLLLE